MYLAPEAKVEIPSEKNTITRIRAFRADIMERRRLGVAAASNNVAATVSGISFEGVPLKYSFQNLCGRLELHQFTSGLREALSVAAGNKTRKDATRLYY